MIKSVGDLARSFANMKGDSLSARLDLRTGYIAGYNHRVSVEASWESADFKPPVGQAVLARSKCLSPHVPYAVCVYDGNYYLNGDRLEVLLGVTQWRLLD